MGGGVVLFDYDEDGDEDAFFIDGGALPGYEGPAPRSRVLRNDADSGADGAPRFVDATEAAGIDFDGYGIGGTAGDVENDGDLALVAVNSNQVAEAYQNGASGAWFVLTFTAGNPNAAAAIASNTGAADSAGNGTNAAGGAANAERDAAGTAGAAAPGARIALTARGTTQVRETRAGSSYLSQGTLAAFFELGEEERIDRIVVRPPSGERPVVLLDLPSRKRALLRR